MVAPSIKSRQVRKSTISSVGVIFKRTAVSAGFGLKNFNITPEAQKQDQYEVQLAIEKSQCNYLRYRKGLKS